MMINWPQTLVRELARRRCVLFLGAGVSASALGLDGARPKDWLEFLQAACALVHNGEKRAVIDGLVKEKRFLLALQAISDETDQADYQNFLEANFNNASFQHSPLHETILKLDSRIVITTNFDKIYQRYCESTTADGYKVISYYSNDIADAIRSDTRLIIKAHGTIDEVSKMIFTKSEYHEAKKSHSHFYAILRAIFLTHTCVFIGCSMDDPDVLLTLEEVRITASSQRPHYALVRAGSQNAYAIKDWKMAYNISAIEYGPDHADLQVELAALAEAVGAMRATQQQ